MEIKSVKSVNNIARLPSVKEHEPGFVKGETVVAKVMTVNGENITLQSRDEIVFSAKVLAQMQLEQGDTLELEVSGREGGKYIMRAISVNPDLVEIGQSPEIAQEAERLNSQIDVLLKALDIEPTAKMTQQIAAAMKNTPNLDVKTAVFMLANNIEPTAENVQILQQFEAQRGTASQVLTEMAAQILLVESLPEGELQSALQYLKGYIEGNRSLPNNFPQSAQAQTPKAASIETGNGFYSVSSAARGTVTIPNINENTMAEATQSAQNITPEQANAANSAAQALSQARELLSGSAVQKGEVQISEAAASVLLQDKEAIRIMAKIFELFSGTDELKSKLSDVKKESETKELKLFALKDAIESTDIKNRQVLESQADRLIAQNKMASDINRFAYFHLPINFGNMQKTADIYVYKRKKKASAKEEGQISILIGIDTESLGRFEVLMRANGKNITVKMSRDSENANEVIELRLKNLRKSFADLGYSLSEFSIERLAQRTTPVIAEEVLAAEDMVSEHRIDYTV